MNQENAASSSPELWPSEEWQGGVWGFGAAVAIFQAPGPRSGMFGWRKRAPISSWAPLQPEGGITCHMGTEVAKRLNRFPQALAIQQQVKRLNINPVCVWVVSGKLSSSASSPCWEQEHSPFEQRSCFSFRTPLKKETPSLSFPHNSQVVRMLAL